jgi:hypothetical protein
MINSPGMTNLPVYIYKAIRHMILRMVKKTKAKKPVKTAKKK